MGGEVSRVTFAPAGEEGVGVVLGDERPDAAAKAASEGRGRGGAEVPRLPREPDRFRDLVAEETFGQVLGLVDEEAEGGGVAASESVAGGRDDPVDSSRNCSKRPARYGAPKDGSFEPRRIRRISSGAPGEEVAAASSVASERPVSRRHRSRIAEVARDRRLYLSRALPAFSAAMPLEATAKVKPSGLGSARSWRTGQKLYCESVPGRLQRIAVWSSLPPNVPTPRSPGRPRNVCPFSRHPR